MRDTNYRDFRVAAALREAGRGLRAEFSFSCVSRSDWRVRLSICNLIRRRFDRLPSEFFIGGY
jgi:hypothetical protein